MCQTKKYEIRSDSVSIDLLNRYRRSHTYHCCPEMPSFVPRVKQFEQIVGIYPVIGDKYGEFRNQINDLVYTLFGGGWSAYVKMRDFINEVSEHEFFSNNLTQNNFDLLKSSIEYVNNTHNHRTPFKLLKHNSPKLSNFVLSMLEYVKNNSLTLGSYLSDFEEFVKKFNDRGAQNLSQYELVISTEPHRIAGMSAFGHYTSCQDWIRKDEDHEYHAYTHQAWANLNDPTCGIAFIRKVGSEEDIDMLARSLVRILPLGNGQTVVYFGRIYSISPFHAYMEKSIKFLALPEDFHAIYLFDGNLYSSGINKYGHTISGKQWVTYELAGELCVYGTERHQCEVCGGSGEIWDEPQCDNCSGSGTVTLYDDDDNEYECDCKTCNGNGYMPGKYIDCGGCDGSGYSAIDDEEYEPYNDHSGWISFGSQSIAFNVPNYIVNWEVVYNENAAI